MSLQILFKLFLGFMGFFFISYPLHQFIIAWVATRFGDKTSRQNGGLTLNPIYHVFHKPTLFDYHYLVEKSPLLYIFVRISGVFAFLFVAVVAGLPLRLGLIPYATSSGGFLPTLFEYLNFLEMIHFNIFVIFLLPIPSLDGSAIIDVIIPEKLWKTWLELEKYGWVFVCALLIIPNMIGVDFFMITMDSIIQSLRIMILGS